MISQKQAIESLENIYNFCEEIDNHLPDDEKTGYKMFPDYQIVRHYVNESVKHGHWIKLGQPDRNGNQDYECSVCHHGDCHAVTQTVPHCWYCGSKNEEEVE